MDMQKKNLGDESRPEFGHANFVRTNPKSARFRVKKFHHIEFWCGNAINSAQRFSFGLGMPIVAKSDLTTGNMVHVSYLLQSGDLNLVFTAPYSPSIGENAIGTTTASIPTFNHCAARSFSASHGFGVRATAIEVDDAESAFNTSISYGAKASSPPMEIGNGVFISEVELYGDVVLRYISFKNSSSNMVFLPSFKDDIRGNSQSGLNSVALANNEESVLLNITEPVYGTERKSQANNISRDNSEGWMYGERCEGNTVQKGGCRGFGKGNFPALFKSIEEYEKTFDP
ncbi:hypothetical protein C5167_015849 [Papaver somniferum]|uniref:4-hydroxyphenylpyruvate dioxygenase n=1 Tax=Papaver somniferum TaxID=3469 RepID=A0A4Y7J859_PAPSO|nr:hypothetical protein C5167_015849 [Papaver somniferum]